MAQAVRLRTGPSTLSGGGWESGGTKAARVHRIKYCKGQSCPKRKTLGDMQREPLECSAKY